MTKLTLPPKLLKMGLDSPKALVLHLPARYEDETELWPIDEALEQGRFTAVQTQGTVLACQVVFVRAGSCWSRLRTILAYCICAGLIFIPVNKSKWQLGLICGYGEKFAKAI